MSNNQNQDIPAPEYSMLLDFLNLSSKAGVKAVEVQDHLLCSLTLALRGSGRRC